MKYIKKVEKIFQSSTGQNKERRQWEATSSGDTLDCSVFRSSSLSNKPQHACNLRRPAHTNLDTPHPPSSVVDLKKLAFTLNGKLEMVRQCPVSYCTIRYTLFCSVHIGKQWYFGKFWPLTKLYQNGF